MRTSFLAALAAVAVGTAASAQTPLKTELVASGFQRPIWVGSPPGDMDRLFVAEQHTGDIEIIKNGTVLGTAFLDLTGKILTGSERGLLGLAFHPDYANNGKFYVNYTKSGSNSGDTIVEEYTVSANPDVANASSGVVVLGPVNQTQSNHNGGDLRFGPDGYLYVSFGDGGGANDGPCNAQNGNLLLGKLVRIDVDNGGVAAPGNPFIGNASFDDRIWAYGIRNPWRFSFDRLTGDLYVGDVGQNAIEEITFVPASSTGGENHGWKMMEGNNCFSTSNCGTVPACNSSSLTDPIQTYGHGGGNCSVTGGFVYRGCAIPDLQGTYFYADYCSDKIWSFEQVGGVATNVIDRTNELDPAGALSILTPSSFGEDACGEIYITDLGGGEVFKIVANAPATWSNLGFAKTNNNGVTPALDACGLLDSGNSADLRLRNAPPNALTLTFASLSASQQPTSGGTLLPNLGSSVIVTLNTDANGEWSIPVPGGSGPLTAIVQNLQADPNASFGVGFSNAIRLIFQP